MALEQVVTQQELAEILDHERQIAWRIKRRDELRSNVHALLAAGAQVEPGRFDAHLKKRIGRSVPWRQLVFERLSPDVIDWFRRRFRTHVYFELEVVEYAVPPLWRNSDESGGSGK